MGTRVVCVSCVLLALACSDGSGPSRLVTVSGILLDSLANRPVDSVQFYFGTDSMTTDVGGMFAFTVPRGSILVKYTDFGRYETFERGLVLERDTSVVLRVRRTLPYLRGFSVSPSGVLQGTVVDLQGAQTVDRGNPTWVVYQDPGIGQSSAIHGNQWTWQQDDALSWHVTITTVSTTITATIWNIMDDQYPAYFTCVRGSECIPNAP